MIELRFIRAWKPEQRTLTHGWLWRHGLHTRHESISPTHVVARTQSVVFVHGRRLAAVIGACLLLGYGSATTAAWWWFQRRSGDAVEFADVAWPPRWHRVRAARTEALFRHGFNAVDEHRFADAARLLGAGLRRDPGRDDARLALVRIYAEFHEYPRAFALLDSALADGRASLELFSLAATLASSTEDYERALSYSRRVLARQPPAPAALLLRARQAQVRALAASGRGDEAAAAAELLARESDSESIQCRIEALCAQRQFERAIALAHAGQKLYPTDGELLGQACRAARDAHDIGALRVFLDTAILARPDQADPRRIAVIEWWQAGERTQATAALNAFLLRFDSDPEVVYQLSTAAAAIGAPPIIAALDQRALSLGQPTARLKANLIEACIVAGDLEGLRRARSTLPDLAATSDPVLQLWPPLVEGIFQVVDGNPLSSGMPLQTLIRRLRLVPASYARFVQLLLTAHRPAAACELLDQGIAIYPAAASLQAIAPRAKSALADAEAAHEPRPAAPEPAVLDASMFFAQAEDLLTAGEHGRLAQLIAEQRRANPIWLDQRSRDVDWLELRLALASGDQLAVRRLGQLYLNGDPHRVDRMIELASQLVARGAKEQSSFLADTILRNQPDARSRLVELGLISSPPPNSQR